MPYTSVAKPTGASYTNINKSTSDIPLYGSAIYGTNKYGQVNAYTNTAKPTGSAYTNVNKPV